MGEGPAACAATRPEGPAQPSSLACVTAPASAPAMAILAGSIPATLMPWLAASESPKKAPPAASMTPGVAAAATPLRTERRC